MAATREAAPFAEAAAIDLDRLSRLATALLKAPVSLVSLIDSNRQVFAAQTGLSPDWAAAGEIPLSHSFCQHVIAGDGPLVIDDARIHPLVMGNLAIRDLDVVAYAGVPVRDPEGNALGSFCVVDSRPRSWSDADLSVLGELAVAAANTIELHGLRRGSPLRDPLTGLPQRHLLLEFAERAMGNLSRGGGETAAVAIGLDAFRLVNEAFGHDGGDQILVTVANRLSAAVRPGDTVCRLAGDEFVVLCERVEDEADALRIADRLLRIIDDAPCDVAGYDQPVTATAGVATTAVAVGPEELVLGALDAMSRVKSGSDDVVERLGAARQTRAGARLRLRTALARAHERGEMRLDYQPLERLGTGQMIGVEALLRWDHPDLGPIAPDAFIPVAEESGAIVAIGEWVLDQACADLAQWRRLGPGRDLHVAVNVAPAQIAVPIFAAQVAETLERHALPASALTLEITERTLLADRAAHRASLSRLRELGVRLALDDFGTGFSALSYLTRFDLDELKIDKAFVDRLDADPQTIGIVEGILAMARALGLRTVAEGIERDSQLSTLRRLGCDVGQGYLLGRPSAAVVVSERLAPGRR